MMRKLVILVLLLALTGCTDFKEQKITKENILKIQNQVLLAKKVTPEESKQFMLGAMSLVKKQGNVYGKTVKEVIEEGKNAATAGKP